MIRKLHPFLFVFVFAFQLLAAEGSFIGKEVLPFINGNTLDYVPWGKVEVVPEAERETRGLIEILEGGFSRYPSWNYNDSGMIHLHCRFINVPEGVLPGVEVTVKDVKGYVSQFTKKMEPDNQLDLNFPVAPDVTSLELWCHNGSSNQRVGVAEYTMTLENYPAAEGEVAKPDIRYADTETLFGKVTIAFSNYENASAGAELQRARLNRENEFVTVSQSPAGAHSIVDNTADGNQTYFYRVRTRSASAVSEWSQPFSVTTPPWFTSPGNTDYYLDAEIGDNNNDGTTPETPWKNGDALRFRTFAPGDRILLKRGNTFTVPLYLQGSGSAEAPIRVETYGDAKARPHLACEAFAAIHLYNGSHWLIHDLEISNIQPIPDDAPPKQALNASQNYVLNDDPFFRPYARTQRRIGVLLDLENIGVAQDVEVSNVYFHDIEGPQDTKEGGGILVRINGSKKSSCYDDLRIKNNVMKHVGRSGIVFQVWPHAFRNPYFPSTRVVIAENDLSDINGDGIVPWACDGVLVTHNRLRRGSCTAYDCNAGIWPWSCDNSKFIGNIVIDTFKHKGNGDAQGYDVDTNNRNTLMEYNVSINNGGGLMLICGEADTPNTDVEVRNCLSINDGMATFALWNNLSNINIHHNTIIAQDDCRSVYMLTNWGKGDADPIQMKNVTFHDNLVYMGTPMELRGRQKSWTLENNTYFGMYAEKMAANGVNERVCTDNFLNVIDYQKLSLWDILQEMKKLNLDTGADIEGLIKALEGTPGFGPEN